jgi:uncharacterized protein (DUF488 family)
MTATGETDGALCTIGYERAALEGFVAALKAAGVATLIDVRSVPWSQRPEFRRAALRKALLAAGLGYVHIRALGNPKEGREAAKAGDGETYRRHMAAQLASADGQRGLARIADLARQGPVSLMCYERDPAHCHRSLVADELAARGLGAPRHLFASPR